MATMWGVLIVNKSSVDRRLYGNLMILAAKISKLKDPIILANFAPRTVKTILTSLPPSYLHVHICIVK